MIVVLTLFAMALMVAFALMTIWVLGPDACSGIMVCA